MWSSFVAFVIPSTPFVIGAVPGGCIEVMPIDSAVFSSFVIISASAEVLLFFPRNNVVAFRSLWSLLGVLHSLGKFCDFLEQTLIS